VAGCVLERIAIAGATGCLLRVRKSWREKEFSLQTSLIFFWEFGGCWAVSGER
jgi:hypothetical protein